ncbi:MAG TPA: DOPA 4,5-dioxygenase family protein [Sphingomicrobium sp.]
MSGSLAPYHAHIYYSAEERPRAERLSQDFRDNPEILFVGRMTDSGVGPHPLPQFEVHFVERLRSDVIDAIAASGLRALVHPLTDDDVADHTTSAHWIGQPLELDVSTLDPPGHNQGIPRFGKSDF